MSPSISHLHLFIVPLVIYSIYLSLLFLLCK